MINFYSLVFFNGLVFVFIFLMRGAVIVGALNPMHVSVLWVCWFFLFFHYNYCFCCFVIVMPKNHALGIAVFL